MTRDDLKEKVAFAIMSRFIRADMHEPAILSDGTRQWMVDHYGELAEAALSAIEGAGMAVVPVDTLRELAAEEVYNAYHAGIEIDGQWMDGGRSEGEWLRDQLGLDDGHHEKSAVWDALPGLVERRVSAMVEAGRVR